MGTYSNYRHQADVCHAYQVVKAKGIPEENIIVMAYDDIANSPSNPFPGKLYNKPDPTGPGVDVYAGCNIDYKGSQVTPENFEKVLLGTASGKSLKSTADDNVFVFFSDHGAAGLIAFPTDTMHKADLQSTLQQMSDKKMFKKLTFYLEACESGSMFQNMNIPGVYGLSASNPTESSWGSYCGSEARVNGKSINSCLGDLFSVSWMEDSDAKDLSKESLTEQFTVVKQLTDRSEVMRWGDLSFDSDMAIEHIGGGASTGSLSAAGEELQQVLADQLAVETAYDTFLNLLYPGDADKQAAIRAANASPDNRDCEMNTRQSFVQYGKFDSFSTFSLQFHKYIVNICADEVATNVDLADVAKRACQGETLV